MLLVFNGKNLLHVASDFTALIDFQLHAEVPWPVSIENRFRAVIVAVNDLNSHNMITVFAIGKTKARRESSRLS
jgi:hypothetical protein